LTCGIAELRKKEVINVRDGMRIGFVNDVEIDLCNANLVAIVIYGKLKFFGLFGREEDIIIRWENVQVVGQDTILVNFYQTKEKHRKKFFSRFFKE
jgi:YlmC/YmxH family sporulation protein